MSYTWGGVAFTVNPDLEGGINVTPIEYGSAMRTADLTLRQDTLGTKDRIVLTFSYLTLGQLSSWESAYATRRAADAVAGGTLVLEEAARTWTVKAALDGFKHLPTVDGGAGAYHYGCTITLDEV